MDNLNELKDGLRQIVVSGCPDKGTSKRGGDSRAKAIEDAIAGIQNDPDETLLKGYIGIKNYAAFGDQREDHSINMGPRHGTIVFSVCRQRGYVGRIGVSAIALLEATRDFPAVPDGEDQYRRKRYLNLCDVLARREKAENELDWCDAALTPTS